MLIATMLITAVADSAFSDQKKRPGELAGCDAKLINRLLSVLENEIIPLTREGVRNGNKVFGGPCSKSPTCRPL